VSEDSPVWTVRKLLGAAADHLAARGAERPRLDAEVLLAEILGRSRLDLYVQHDMPVGDAARSRLRGWVRRRSRGEPVAYLVGHREFYSLKFRVDRRCLIPRPETEHLVDEALRWLRHERSGSTAPPRVLDVGTGSGCIAVSLACNFPAAIYHAIDVSAAALDVARLNRGRLAPAAAIHFHRGDLLAALARGPVADLVVSNPPYVTGAEMSELPREVRHEPELALYSGDDGVALHRRVLEQAAARLVRGGAVMLELPEGGRDPLLAWASERFPSGRFRTVDDYAGVPRVFVGEGLAGR
jgi:release factor glutamine methyltransferase